MRRRKWVLTTFSLLLVGFALSLALPQSRSVRDFVQAARRCLLKLQALRNDETLSEWRRANSAMGIGRVDVFALESVSSGTEALEEAILKFPNVRDQVTFAHQELAGIYLDQGQVQKANEELDQIKDKFKDDPDWLAEEYWEYRAGWLLSQADGAAGAKRSAHSVGNPDASAKAKEGLLKAAEECLREAAKVTTQDAMRRSYAAAIPLPFLARAVEKIKRYTCQGNMKVIGTALTMYMQDYDERHMGDLEEMWPVLLRPYVRSPEVYTCPRDGRAGSRPYPGTVDTSYGFISGSGPSDPPWINYKRIAGKPLADFAKPARTVTAADNTRVSNGTSPGYIYIVAGGGESAFAGFPQGDFAVRHYGGANILFLDGHVKWVETKILKGRIDNGSYLYE